MKKMSFWDAWDKSKNNEKTEKPKNNMENDDDLFQMQKPTIAPDNDPKNFEAYSKEEIDKKFDELMEKLQSLEKVPDTADPPLE